MLRYRPKKGYESTRQVRVDEPSERGGHVGSLKMQRVVRA